MWNSYPLQPSPLTTWSRTSGLHDTVSVFRAPSCGTLLGLFQKADTMRINEQSEMGPNRSVARAFPGGPGVKTLCSLQGRSRAADVENGLVDQGEEEGKNGKSSVDIGLPRWLSG